MVGRWALQIRDGKNTIGFCKEGRLSKKKWDGHMRDAVGGAGRVVG